jgi:hypothetical protein
MGGGTRVSAMPVNPSQHLGALRGVTGLRSAVAAALVALVALSSVLIGCQARPRTIVVDDFESGAITGWQAVGGGSGGWFVYSNGHKAPIPPRAIPTSRSMSPIRPKAGSRR